MAALSVGSHDGVNEVERVGRLCFSSARVTAPSVHAVPRAIIVGCICQTLQHHRLAASRIEAHLMVAGSLPSLVVLSAGAPEPPLLSADKFELTEPRQEPNVHVAEVASPTPVLKHAVVPGPVRRSLEQFHRTMATASGESGSRGPVEAAMHDKLTTLLQPSRLTITNESHLHRHHAAMRAQGGGHGETHFAVQIISEAFNGKTTLQRHRLIYSALSDEFAQGLHALSLKTSTSGEARQLAAGQAE